MMLSSNVLRALDVNRKMPIYIGTHCCIGTRVFNTEAKDCYHERLHFAPMVSLEVKELLGLDPDSYCGFQHWTTEMEIKNIQTRMQNGAAASEKRRIYL